MERHADYDVVLLDVMVRGGVWQVLETLHIHPSFAEVVHKAVERLHHYPG
jgi:hypothetical protein